MQSVRCTKAGLLLTDRHLSYYSEVGIGVKPDLDEAKMWYLRAAGEGHLSIISRLMQHKLIMVLL